MKRRESLTRAEFLVQLAGATLAQLAAPQQRGLLKGLVEFCRDPQEALWGDMRPAPTWGDVAEIQRCVRVLLEETTIPVTLGTKAATVAREDAPAITVRDLDVRARPSPAAASASRDLTPRQAFAEAAQVAARDYYAGVKRRPVIIARSAPLDVVMLLTVATLAQGPLPPVARCADPHCPRKWFIRRGKKRFCNDRCRVRAFVRAQRAEMREAERRESERRSRRPASGRTRARARPARTSRRVKRQRPTTTLHKHIARKARHARKGGV